MNNVTKACIAKVRFSAPRETALRAVEADVATSIGFHAAVEVRGNGAVRMAQG
jgi:hypothetical protein